MQNGSEVAAMPPAQRVSAAAAWIAEDYPRKWLRLVNLCEWAMDQGWPRIRRGDLYLLAGQRGMDVTLCREFRFDNNLWAALSRYLIMFRPSLARVIFPRAVPGLDAADFVGPWRRHVSGRTFLYGDTWQEADEHMWAAR